MELELVMVVGWLHLRPGHQPSWIVVKDDSMQIKSRARARMSIIMLMYGRTPSYLLTLLYAVCNVIIFQVARTRQLAAPSCVAASCCSSISCIIDHLFGPV
jgi:hypothetical protein